MKDINIPERPVLEMVQELRIFDACKQNGYFSYKDKCLIFDEDGKECRVVLAMPGGRTKRLYEGDNLEEAVDILLEINAQIATVIFNDRYNPKFERWFLDKLSDEDILSLGRAEKCSRIDVASTKDALMRLTE